MFNTKLVDGLSWPVVKLNVGPFNVNVVQESWLVDDGKSKLPPFQVNVLEHVNGELDKSNVPSVNVAVVQLVEPASVVVIPDVLMTKGPIDVFVRIEPEPTIVAVNDVRTLVLKLDFKELRLRLVAAVV